MLHIINESNSGNTAHEELNRVITTCPLSPICVKMNRKQHKNITDMVQAQVVVIEQVGDPRWNIRRKTKRWMEKQHLVSWRGPCSAQRQA